MDVEQHRGKPEWVRNAGYTVPAPPAGTDRPYRLTVYANPINAVDDVSIGTGDRLYLGVS